MKKKIILSVLIVLLCSLGVIACGDSVDTTSPAKIVLTVESSVPTDDLTVVASRGEFKKNGNVFTLSLDNRNLTTVSVSAKGFKTFSTEVKASDYVDGVYSKTVNFDEKLGTSIELSVKSMTEEVTLTCDNEDFTITKTGGNKFSLYIPERGAAAECNVTLSAEGYEPRVYDFTKEVLASGYYIASTRLIKTGYKMIEVANTNYGGFIVGRNFDVYSASLDYSTRIATYVVKDNDVILLQTDSNSKCIYTKDLPVYGTIFDNFESSTNRDKYVIIDESINFPNSNIYLLNNDTWERVYVSFQHREVDKSKGMLVAYFPKAGQYTTVVQEDYGDYFARDFTIREEDFNNLSYALKFPNDRRKLTRQDGYMDYYTQQPIVFPDNVKDKDQWLIDNGYTFHSYASKLDGDNYFMFYQYAKRRTLTLKFDMDKSIIGNLNMLSSNGAVIESTTDSTITIYNFGEGNVDNPYISFELSYDYKVPNGSYRLASERYNILLSDENLIMDSDEWVYNVPLVFHGYGNLYIDSSLFKRTALLDTLDDMPSELKSMFSVEQSDMKGYFSVNTIQLAAEDSSMIKKVGSAYFVRHDAKFLINLMGNYYGDTYEKNYQGSFTIKTAQKYTYTELLNTLVMENQQNYYDVEFVKVSHKISSWSNNNNY